MGTPAPECFFFFKRVRCLCNDILNFSILLRETMADQSQEMGDYAADVQGAEERLEVSAATRAAVREATGEIAAAMGEAETTRQPSQVPMTLLLGFYGRSYCFLKCSWYPPPLKTYSYVFFTHFSPIFFSLRPMTQICGWTSRSVPRRT